MKLADELWERSRHDDEIIVGSEIRAALQEQRDRIGKLKYALSLMYNEYDGVYDHFNGYQTRDAIYACESARKALEEE